MIGYTPPVTAGWILLTTALLSPAPLASLGHGAGLSAAAAASGRPPECSSGSRRALARGPSVWEIARVPNLQRYCDLVARAQTELAATPDRARKDAQEAEVALPGHAAPQVVIARAALSLGAIEEAARAFARARELDPRSVEDPGAMHDLARVLHKTGKRDEALAVYRALVPRVDLLGTTDRRVSVLLEAAHASMTAEGAGGAPAPAELTKPRASAKRRLDEAVAYLREARQRPPTQLSGEVLLSLALALDRAGDRDEADATLAEALRANARLRSGTLDYLAAPEDRAALEALVAEGGDRAAAQKAWEAYLAGPGGKGPWAAAARARLDVVKRGGGRLSGLTLPAKREAAPPSKPVRPK
jgi:tetratricopeptide (TPR) repeat protein